MNERMKFLLTKAAEEMNDYRSPFADSFLSEHNVTLHEAFDMSELIAQCVMFVVDMEGIL